MNITSPAVGHARPRYNLHMIKYVGWYLVMRTGANELLFKLPQWGYGTAFNAPLVYNESVSTVLGFACVVLAACMTGIIFAENFKRLPERNEARILAGSLALLSLVLFGLKYYWTNKLLSGLGSNSEEFAAVEKYVERPKDLAPTFYAFYAFYLLFHYWLIGWLFVKGAALRLCHLKKEKRENGETR